MQWLIDNGANVFATDRQGLTVRESLYQYVHQVNDEYQHRFPMVKPW